MNAPDGEAAAKIAEALARLRGTRMMPGPRGMRGMPWGVGGPGFPPGTGMPPGFHGAGGHGHGGGRGGHGPHGAGRGDRGPFGRSAARLRLLEMLASADGPYSISELADRIGVDQPRASRLVQTIVDVGFARREVDPADARRTLIALTDAGRAFVAEARGARAGAIEQALAGFTDDERDQLASLLSRLADAWPR